MHKASIKRARITDGISEPSKELRSSTLKSLRLQLSSSKLLQNEILDWSETPAATARRSGKRIVLFASQDSAPATARSHSSGWDELPLEMYLCKLEFSVPKNFRNNLFLDIFGDFTLHQLLRIQLVARHWKDVVDFAAERLVKVLELIAGSITHPARTGYVRKSLPRGYSGIGHELVSVHAGARVQTESREDARLTRCFQLVSVLSCSLRIHSLVFVLLLRARERGHERCMLDVARSQPDTLLRTAFLEQTIATHLAPPRRGVSSHASERVLIELCNIYNEANGEKAHVMLFASAISQGNTAGFDILLKFFRKEMPSVSAYVLRENVSVTLTPFL
jgi:hypothetical protein